MISLHVSAYKQLRLEFSTIKTERFSECILQFIDGDMIKNLYEDYLYIFIDEMLGRLKSIPVINSEKLFGKIGEWQEYFYFDTDYYEKHYKEINVMNEAIFISTENYGLFLYQYNGRIWLEIDKGFFGFDEISPLDYYSDPHNYRVLLSNISAEMVEEWMRQLETVKKVIS